MNKKDAMRVAQVIVFFAMWLFYMACLLISGRLPYRYQKLIGTNGIYIDNQNRNFMGILTSIASDGDYIYCCFGKRYIAKVYDTEGNYISTIAISDGIKQTHFLFVGERDNQVVCYTSWLQYTFKNAELVSYDLSSSPYGEMALKRITKDAQGNVYRIQDGWVVKKTPEGDWEAFGEQPWYLRLMGSEGIILFMLPGFICMLVLEFIMRKKWGY